MSKSLLLLSLLCIALDTHAQSSSPAVRYSELLLYALRDKQPSQQLQRELQQYPAIDLLAELKEDRFKKAFWINIYNAFTQIGLRKKTGLTTVPHGFFTEKFIQVGGKTYSLSVIENIFLKPGKPGLHDRDYRIHFALNKGAESSPAIIIYDSEDIESLLDIATNRYLRSMVHMDEDGFEAEVPELLKQYRSDFGGKKKIIELLRKNEVVYMNVTPELAYKKYNWRIKLNNFLPAESLQRQGKIN